MYFKRLEMHGFKSFAEPVTIEFHEGVTCIVGPNGSGKSNVSDAVRWVLGEQSPKQLRGSKMEEVIFSGTASRKSRGMAEVTLVIDNSTGILPIDYNEVAITRRMYRSGESEYLINNNQCRLRDIRELIMDTGIGVEGYSIIGQGKIADVVSNKPEERRAIFEEAAGVMAYKSRKQESERKLSSASANLERVNDIIGEIESRIDGLREDSIKAQEYLQLKEKSRELDINITLRGIERLEAANAAIREDVKSLTAEIDGAAGEKRALDEKVAAGREKSETLEQLSEEARDKLLASVEEINRLTSSSRISAERLSSLDRDTARLAAESEVLRDKLSAESNNLQELNEQKAAAEAALKKADEALKEKADAYNETAEKAASLAEKADESKNRMYALYNDGAAKRSEIKSMESFRESLAQRKTQLTEERERAAKGSEAFAAELSKARAELESAESAAAEAAKRIAESRQALDRADGERRELVKNGSHLELEISRINARRKTIEEMEANYEGYNGAVRFIMKRGLSGLIGTVAEVIKVPEGLEIAVETALGAALQNVVCKKDADAKAAINLLKENRAGRLTFLPVESIRGKELSLPPSVKGDKDCLGTAAGLVSAEAEFKNIVDYLLGRVVIVKGMQKAIDFAKQTGGGARFVTLEGEVVNAAGAITGGKYKNATANLLERRGEVEKLASSAENLEQELADGRLALADKEKEIDALNSRLTKEEAALTEAKLSVRELNMRIEAVNEQFAGARQSAERQQQQLASLSGDQAETEAMIEKLTTEAAECEAEAEKCKAEIEELMKLQEEVKDEVDAASDAITATRIERNKVEAQLAGVLQILKRVEEAAADLTAQIEAREAEAASAEEEKKRLLSGSGASAEAIEEATAEKKRLEEYLQQAGAERTELSAVMDAMLKEQSALGEKLNSFQDRKYQEEIKLARNETQLDTFKEKLWEDFEISYMQALEMRKEDFVISTAQRESREIRNRIKELGDVNVGAIQEYAQVSERYRFLTEQRADIIEAMEQLNAIIEDMERTIKARFKDKFDKIVVNFEEAFTTLFGGGHAELRLENEKDPLEAGIEIIAQPPGKKLQNINLMSGGEKTMTAIALMFAVLKATPTPFCIMDEVEAALDDSNIDRFANYLRSFNGIQFTIVTHQKATMEHADVLYGVTMPEKGVSKVLSLRLGDDFEV